MAISARQDCQLTKCSNQNKMKSIGLILAALLAVVVVAKFCGKRGVISVVIFAAVLLGVDLTEALFGAVAGWVYTFIVVLVGVAIGLSRRKRMV